MEKTKEELMEEIERLRGIIREAAGMLMLQKPNIEIAKMLAAGLEGGGEMG